jgi:hypothetical protein
MLQSYVFFGWQIYCGDSCILQNEFLAKKFLVNFFKNGRLGTVHFPPLAVYYRRLSIVPQIETFTLQKSKVHKMKAK